jgi:hypothetical protein
VKRQNRCFKWFWFTSFSFPLNLKRFNKWAKRFHKVILIRSRIISLEKMKCFYFSVNLEPYQMHPKILLLRVYNFLTNIFAWFQFDREESKYYIKYHFLPDVTWFKWHCFHELYFCSCNLSSHSCSLFITPPRIGNQLLAIYRCDLLTGYFHVA